MKRQLLTLSALALTSFALVACNSTKEASTKDSSQPSVVKASSETSQSSSVKTSSTKKEYALGEKINLEDKAEVTIKSVAYTDERNQFSDAQPDKVIVVTYDVTNLSEDDYFVGSELTLYINGKKMESYPVATTLETISAGRTYENATQAFGVSETGKGEIEIKPSWSWGTKPVVVAFTLE
ncbi:hypothetical protein ACVRZR_07165 [Streptococcus entericus]|uniref:hypothetical protein n=1 Tax=Streptococcus entericus TaxID=155680 RepID=UPI0003608CF0|nr:hypothetical protein [Streptococcus entericus]